MENQFKYSISITLTLMITLSLTMILSTLLVSAATVGGTQQSVPYESSPTTYWTNKAGVYVPLNPANAYDKDPFTTFASLYIDDGTAGAIRAFEVSNFTTPASPPFTIGWVDFKMRYSVLATTDDQYRITYFSGLTAKSSPTANTTVALQDWTNVGENIYNDTGPGNVGTVGYRDRRLTIVAGYSALSTVWSAEKDVGQTLVSFQSYEKHAESTVNGRFDIGELIYNDTDLNGQISIGDVRLRYVSAAAQGYYAAGSVVSTGDLDIGDYPLISFSATEKHTEDVAVEGKYTPRLTAATIGSSTLARDWFNKPTNDTTAWTWADITSIKLRVETCMRGSNDGKLFLLYEVWLTVYPLPLPPSASAAVSVWPNSTLGLLAGQGKIFFVDIYARSVSDLFSIEFTIEYNTTVLTATEAYFYYPWADAYVGTPTINDGAGYVYMTSGMFKPVKVGQAFYGDSPIARIYFRVDAGGESKLFLRKGAAQFVLGDSKGVAITRTIYDGWFASPRYLSAIDASNNPITVDTSWPAVNNTRWRELYPYYSKIWNLTSLEDTAPSGLSRSDQIDMLNATRWKYWFHIENVTITIHWSNSTTGESGKAEPVPPRTSMGTGTPVGQTWHEIRPTFSRRIDITSWIDSDGHGTFNQSDYFDFEYTDEQDVLLAGTAPSYGSTPLSTPGDYDRFYDANTNNEWDAGEPAIYDANLDGYYFTSDGDYVLVGNAPDEGANPLLTPGGNDRFYDANTNSIWDVNEPAIRDVDGNGKFTELHYKHWAHLDHVSTDILVSMKPMPPVYVAPPIPEFPLGIEILMAITPIIPIIYLWRKRPKKRG